MLKQILICSKSIHKSTQITNLLFVIKTRQPLKQNFMLNCKKTMIKKKELL